MSAGSDNDGLASLTVIVKLAGSASFPAGSCAWQLTVVAPIGNVSPACAGPHVIVRTLAASSGSIAVTANDTTAPSFDVAVAVRSPGPWMTGAVVSRNVFVSVHVCAAPAAIVIAP